MPDLTSIFSPAGLQAVAFVLLAIAALVVAIYLIETMVRQEKSKEQIEEVLHNRENVNLLTFPGAKEAVNEEHQRLESAVVKAAALGSRLGQGRFGDVLLAEEDKAYLELGGFEDYSKAKALFSFARAVLCIGLPVILLFVAAPVKIMGGHLMTYVLSIFFGFALGWMLPKWVLMNRVNKRKKAVDDELPLLVDLLRLLQGVGMSMDQSLYIIVKEFKAVFPVLCMELEVAVEQYNRGMSREQSMDRMINGMDNDDLTAICHLIAQVDKHGGAVQEPLTRFSERLREQRRSGLKEKIGKLTVKMTGVMVLTLLPALMIVTAGSGFIAVFRGLSRMGGG
ncbi:type II secretion system F family protein [Advenella alkanexedens]|uniref:type II secretion system F family protein n=1 Tax=Advenella alkanexedens TaxID=1481665 RepID=UPI00267551C1|nr:type II secretion system F family protein [Advenella alkanexedens]WKU19600.1 type II secretion system F family protein [Advenella alkanexedens]